MSQKEIKTLLLRMDAELYDRVKEAAEANRMSMTKFVCSMLEGVKATPLDLRFDELEQRIIALEKEVFKK